ncbi:hypothetical protein C9J12_28825 [Photobacterium frigidiphilum]|uniref:Uncharacterized protein n=1 Tax=Photobacterium frigidiphilum TaxID=264736 RepID=A0A2T3J641_9GAMM|nr:hypothetical protein C9J12_28825 [Photobacterium frigidiphilum]
MIPRLKNITSNISCATANSPNTPNSIPKLQSKTCQLDVFVITAINQKLKSKIQRKTFNNNSPFLFCDSLNTTQ